MAWALPGAQGQLLSVSTEFEYKAEEAPGDLAGAEVACGLQSGDGGAAGGSTGAQSEPAAVLYTGRREGCIVAIKLKQNLLLYYTEVGVQQTGWESCGGCCTARKLCSDLSHIHR